MRRVAPVGPGKHRVNAPLIPRNAAFPNAAKIVASMITRHRSTPMMDIFMSALGLALFAGAIGYAYACERL